MKEKSSLVGKSVACDHGVGRVLYHRKGYVVVAVSRRLNYMTFDHNVSPIALSDQVVELNALHR